MISIDENQGPESYFDQMSSSRSASFSYSEDDILTFKLYENVNSRPLPEEELRSKFSGYVDYLLYCFSLTGSLANLTRFPYLAYMYNGCSFLVQFLILVVLIGIPWCFMETALGQYSGRGPTALGDMVPIGKGVALAMSYICLLNVICYSPIQSRCLLYMYWSLSEPQLPWKICGFVNNTSQCIDERKHFTKNGTKSVGIELCVPMENFYLNEIVQMDKSVLYNGLGNVNVPLLGCLAVSWIINFSLLNATSNLMKYIQIFGSIIPFPFLFIMLFIIMTDKDAWDGFYTLFDPSTIDFLDLQSWRRAAEQVLYSLDVGTGHLIIYGKNCNFRDNILSSILSVALLDIICAVAASLIIFGTANILAYKFHITFQSVFISGPGMFLIAISRAVTDLPFPRLSSFLAFFVLLVICILTQLSFLKPVIYLLKVYFARHNLNQSQFSGILCITMFGLSLATITSGGEELISLLDDIGSAMGILVITTFEAILIFGIYGISEFCTDLTFMSNHPPSIILKILFIGGPVFIINIMLACSFYWIPPSFQNVNYPPEFYTMAWAFAILTFLIIITAAVYTIVQFTIKNNFYGSFRPTDRWVPDIVHSLNENQLEYMTELREKLVYTNANRLVFGIGKPRLSIKIDAATQTNEQDDAQFVDYVIDEAISNNRMQHFYLEVLNNINQTIQISRRHNENEVIAWNGTESLPYSGVLEKYVQTD